jgi:membrane-associated PAP2 superfamily phosphatase
MTYLNRLSACLISLAFALIYIHYNDLDIKFQSLFFNFESKSWLINKDDQELKFFLYRLPKYLIVTYGVSLIIYWIKLFLNKQDRDIQKKIIFLILSLLFTPLTVSLLKHYSPINCPYHIREFYGCCLHISPLDVFKSGVFFAHAGKCFPAGHASGGFALISLYFVAPQAKKHLALCFSLALGSIMGLYQIAKGAHYLSDTIFTLAIAYIVSISLEKIILKHQETISSTN